jgi:hypothetical protein
MTRLLRAHIPRGGVLRCAALLAASLLALPAWAARSAGCEGGGFTVLHQSGLVDTDIPAARVPARFLVQGKYVQFYGSRKASRSRTTPSSPAPIRWT